MQKLKKTLQKHLISSSSSSKQIPKCLAKCPAEKPTPPDSDKLVSKYFFGGEIEGSAALLYYLQELNTDKTNVTQAMWQNEVIW